MAYCTLSIALLLSQSTSCLETPVSTSSHKRAFQRGQGMLEYALIVFLIAVVAIIGIVFLVPVILQGLSGALPAL
jgi:Flp pilus assembly pilin Flp